MTEAMEARVVQLQLLELMIEKREVRVPVDARAKLELIDLMASILVTVFEAQVISVFLTGPVRRFVLAHPLNDRVL